MRNFRRESCARAGWPQNRGASIASSSVRRLRSKALRIFLRAVAAIGGAILAVGVTVLVSVFVAVAAGGLGAVEQEGHVVVLLGAVVFLHLAEHGALEQAGTHDKDGDVGERGDQVGVGHDLDRRAVEEDVVVALPKLVEERGQARLGEELGGVRRHSADGKDIQSVAADLMDDERGPVVAVAVEVVGEAPFGLSGQGAQRTFAQVEVEDDDLLALDRKGGGQVGGDEGLAGSDVEGGDHQDFAAGVLAAHELEVGPHDAEGLVDHVSAVGHDDDLAVFGVVGDLDPVEDVLFLVGRGQLAEEGGGHILEVFAAADGGVEDFLEVEPGERNREAEQESDQIDHFLVRSDRGAGTGGRGHDTGVVGGEGLREFIFLAFLEEEEVQGLLDLLLAFVGEQASGLERDVAHARLRGALGLLRGTDLDADGLDVVVQGGQDGAAQRAQLLVQVFDEEVLFGGGLDQAVALEHRRVVLVDLALGAGIVDAYVGRQQGAGGGAGDVGLKEAGDGELVVELHQVLAGLGGELHVHAGRGFVVGDPVFTLVGGDGLVHVAEFLLDDVESVGDELVGGGRDLVLVLDPVLVVDVDDHAKDVLGALGVDILEAEVDHGRVLVAEGGGEVGAVAARGPEEAGAADQDRAIPFRLVGVLRLRDEDLAQRGVGRISVGSRDLLAFDFVAPEGEVRKDAGGRVFKAEFEARGLVAAEVEEFDLDGEAGAVDRMLVAEALDLVVHVEVEVADHLLHQVGGEEVDDLVVDIDAGLAESEVGEGRGDVGGDGAGAAVFLDQDRGAAGVDGHGREHIVGRGQEAHGQGDGEPFPVVDAQGPDVLEGEVVVFLLGFRTVVIIVFHMGVFT